ncbi:MAG: DUF192 domain-containing protein [Halobacteriovoraceae bacterium]|jgi:uncharacterized membrane protein (UPF0127 family)|nr:DUF192 domain-containing protein [Halobacteriovoraceae bacterium]
MILHQRGLKLIIFLYTFAFFCACNAQNNSAKHLKAYPQSYLYLPNGEKFKVYIAQSPAQQKQGLSKIQSIDFSNQEGMLFPEESMFVRQFWMPETFFDLDLFFMNQDYYILGVHRGLKHYPKKGDRSQVPLSKKVFSQHVVELKAGSYFAKKLMPGMQLKLKKK